MSEHSGEFATEPVPENRRVRWPRVALIAALVAFSLPTFRTGLEVSSVVSAETALLALTSGGAILALIGSITGSIGARTHRDAMLVSALLYLIFAKLAARS